jgi:hypothetical protein
VRIVCVLLAPLPILSPYLNHYAAPNIPTGFIHGDMPYYSANGRAIFERGNGFAYPNPYDPDPKAPVIYFHWLLWILGFGITHLGFDPGLQFCAIGVLASFVCSWFTLRLVEALLPDARFRYTLFFLVMWGGGILCLWQAASMALGLSQSSSLFAFDPARGWCFLNWGRSLTFPTEAVYHALVAATWLAVVTQRRLLVLLGPALLATTHPFSGFQLLLMLTVWFSIRTLVDRARADLGTALVLMVFLALFLGYYRVYLNSFAAHRDLQHVWALPWIVPIPSMLLAYGPVGLLALLRVLSERKNLDDNAWFFLVCFGVSVFLAKHELFFSPHQPWHFTRGYIWTPLCLVALPLIQRILIHCRLRTRPLAFALLVFVVAGIAVSDNASFITRRWIRRFDPSYLREGFYLTADEAEAFQWMDRQGLDGVLLCPERILNYLSATYTAVRPFYGHTFNTPHYWERFEQVKEWQTHGREGAWFADIDYILLNRKDQCIALLGDGWEVAFENAELVLYQRKSGDDPSHN